VSSFIGRAQELERTAAALAESRKAFDQANQTAWNALKGSAPPKG